MCRISQFPDDDEHVLGPLSHFEVVGMQRELMCSPDTYTLNVIEVKLNRNLQAKVFPTSPPFPLARDLFRHTFSMYTFSMHDKV